MYHPPSADLARSRAGELERLARHPDRLLVHDLEVTRSRSARRRRFRPGR